MSVHSDANIELFDMTGRIVRQWKKTNDSLDFLVDISELTNGIYYLILKDENGNKQTSKVFKDE